MRARSVKTIRRFIEAEPDHPSANILADLVLALEKEGDFPVSRLYELDTEHFEWALDLLGDWRIDRYYLGKAKLFDVSLQHQEMRSGEDGQDEPAPPTRQ